jgi:hypothetical protein
MLNHDGACRQCRRSGCPGPGLRGQCPRYTPGRGLRATARAQPPPAARGPAVALALSGSAAVPPAGPDAATRLGSPRRACTPGRIPPGDASKWRGAVSRGVGCSGGAPRCRGLIAARRAAVRRSPRGRAGRPGGPLAFFNSDGASEQQARAVPPGGCHCGAKRISLSSCQPEGPTDSEESGLPESPSRARSRSRSFKRA